MPLFYYRAVNREGGVQSGRAKMENEASVIEFLRADGLLPVEIKKLGFFKGNFDILNQKLNANDASVFLSQAAFALKAGLGITGTLKIIQGQTKSPCLRKTLPEMIADIEAGGSLSEGFKRHKGFPAIFSGMAEVGEKTGRLPDVFLKLSHFYEAEAKIKEEIKKAMIYPVVVSIAMLFVIVVSVVFVLPGYARMFNLSGAELPFPTRILLDISAFISKNHILLLLILCIIIIGLAVFFNLKAGRKFIGSCLLNIPLISGIYKKTMNMRFSYVLGILSDSGVDTLSSLDIINLVLGNKALEPVIDNIRLEIEKGGSLSAAVSKIKYFDPIMAGMLTVGEQTGRLPETVSRASEFLQVDLYRMTGNLNKLVEPLITIVLGLVLAFVMLAVMLPSFSLMEII